jgi:hypothetical protein
LYSKILKHGHWASFLEYAWKYTDCAERSGFGYPSDWINSANGNEDNCIMELFYKSEFNIFDTISAYFHTIEQFEYSHCLRCRGNPNNQQNDYCALCGLYVTENTSPIAISVNLSINAQYVKKHLQYLALEYNISQLDKKAIRWSEESESMEKNEKEIQREMKELKRMREFFQERQKEFSMQEEEIRELERILKNAAPLFLQFDDRTSEQAIYLTLKGHILFAKAYPPQKFPIDLIMGLQKTSDKPAAKTINKTSCFLFIPVDKWIEESKGSWKVDLQEIAAGKVKGDFFTNCFSHLHKKDYLSNIRYDINIISFR